VDRILHLRTGLSGQGLDAGPHTIPLIQDRHIRVIAATTGELLRDLVLYPTRDYQPQNRPQTPD
jgi:hypothetical protein